MSTAYRRAGVDIEAGEALVEAIKPLAAATNRAGASGALGGFGGMFDIKAAGFDDPILVSGTDGVGTKLKIAIENNCHSTVGIDLVAMCVNDILAQGAMPLFFLDYFACGKLEPAVARDVIGGIAEGCKQAGAALIGGETAEMPGMYLDGDYDIAGFCVGAVERDKVLPVHAGPDAIREGDVLIGLPSSGVHSNGFSLVRRIVKEAGLRWEAPAPFDAGKTVAEAFLMPTRIYVSVVNPLLDAALIKGFAHITGGGLTDNVPRVLPSGLTPRYDEQALRLPPVFEWLQTSGRLSDDEMRRTFNCGIGGVIVCSANAHNAVMYQLHEAGQSPRIIGTVQ